MSGDKPNLERRRQIAALRAQGFSLAQIWPTPGHQQAVRPRNIEAMHRPTPLRSVACLNCGSTIISPGALPEDACLAPRFCCLASDRRLVRGATESHAVGGRDDQGGISPPSGCGADTDWRIREVRKHPSAVP